MDEANAPDGEPSLQRRLARLEDRLEALDDSVASRLAGYEHVETRLAFRLAELERSDQRLAERLDAVARFEAGLEERAARLDGAVEALREVADEVETGLASRVGALERTEAGLGERLAALRRHDGQLRQGLEGLQRAVGAAEEVAETELPAATARLVETLRAQGTETDEAFAARLEALEEVAEGLADHGAGLGRLEAELAERLGEVARTTGGLEERGAALAEVDERLRERGEALSAVVGQLEEVGGTRLVETLGEVARTDDRLGERARGLEALEAVLAERVEALEHASSVLTERIGRLQQATASVERAGGSELAGRLDRFDTALASLAEVVARLESGGDAVAAGVEQQRDAHERQRRELATAIRGAEARMVAAVQDGVAGFVAEATEAATAARTAGERLGATLRDLDDLDASLAEHRGALAEVLGRDRRALLDEILDRVLAEVTGRARRRLAQRLVEHDERAGSSTPEIAPGARSGVDSAHPVSSTAHTSSPNARSVAVGGDEGRDDDAATPDTAPESGEAAAGGAGEPGSHRRAQVPVRRPTPLAQLLGEEEVTGAGPADDGPALTDEELRQAREQRAEQEREHLAERAVEVRGIGPARAQLLAEMFGDLDTLLAASADQVAARTGLAEELAAEVLAHLRR